MYIMILTDFPSIYTDLQLLHPFWISTFFALELAATFCSEKKTITA